VDLGYLASGFGADVVELGSTNPPWFFDFQFCDPGRIQGVDAFYSYISCGDLSNCKTSILSPAPDRNDKALEDLDSFFVALHDPVMDADDVTHVEGDVIEDCRIGHRLILALV